MRDKLKFFSDKPWLLALIIFTIVVIPGFIRVEQINRRLDDTVYCMKNWADATVRRTTILTEANNLRNNASDDVLLAAARADRDLLVKKLNDYKAASDNYKSALNNNPIPESPKLICLGE